MSERLKRIAALVRGGMAMGLKDRELAADLILESARPEAACRWIPMDERAPEDQAFVLVNAGTPQTWELKTTCRYHADWVNGFTKGPAFTDASGGIIHDVSHWMPLPASPFAVSPLARKPDADPA